MARRRRTSIERDAEYSDGLALVLQFHRRTLHHTRWTAQHAPEFVGQEDLTRLRDVAQALRRVHGVADERELEPALGADVARERLAEIEPDADLQLRATDGPPLRVQLVELVNHLDGGRHRVVGVFDAA